MDNEKTCPVCSRLSPRGGFCRDCERKIKQRFPNGEWEMMEIEAIIAALHGIGPAQPAVHVDPDPRLSHPSSSGRRKNPSPLPLSGRRPAAKKKAPSPWKRIIPGVLLVALVIWLTPYLAGDLMEYRSAAEKQEVQADLKSYQWAWDSDKEQYRIDARYGWSVGGFSGTVGDTQYNSPSRRSTTSRTGLTQQGKDSDPAEVRPRSSIKVRLYKKPDGTWRTAPTQGIMDSLSLIIGFAAAFAAGVWLTISGLLIWRRQKD